MLERIREGSQGFWAKAILGLVILTFALAGVGSYLNTPTDNPVAVVNGEEIPQSSLERAYENEKARMEAQYGDGFANMLADTSYRQTFRQGILDRLVADKLVEQTASNLGLRASDEQVKQAIVEIPSFHIAGQFNNDRYLSILRANGMQPGSFSESVRTDLTRQLVMTSVLGSEFSLNNEVELAYQLQQQTRDFSFIEITSEEFKQGVEVTEGEIENFYHSNITRFDTEQKVALSYVELKVDDLLDAVTVSDEEVQQTYQDDMQRYKTEEERRASHILLEKGEDEAAAIAQAQEIIQRLNAGEDFAALATELSTDTFSAENGGDLDWFGRDVMDPAFEKATFELANEGDISEPVVSDFGVHIIKLTGIKAEDVKPLEEVKEAILTEIKRQKAKDRFDELQQEMATLAFEQPDDLVEVAALVSQEIKQTELFSRNQAPAPFTGNIMLNAAFSDELIEDRVNSEVLEVTNEHLLVLRVVEQEEQRTKALNEVSEEIKQELIADKAQEAAKAWADELAAKVLAGDDVSAELESKSLVWNEQKESARYGAGAPRAVLEKAFTLALDEDKSMATVNTFSGNVALVRLDNIHQKAESDEAMLERISQGLASGKGQKAYVDFIEALKADAKIELKVTQVAES